MVPSVSEIQSALPKKESHSLILKQVRALNAHTFLMTLEMNPAKAKSCLPGQFFNLRPLRSTAPLLRRPISVCDARPETGEIDFLVRRTGEGTIHLVQHLPGEKMDAMGPLGNPFSPELKKPAIMIAGGVGVAPLYFLSRWMKRNSTDGSSPNITFCYGARSKDDLVLLEKIESVVSELVVTTEDGSFGQKGFITAAIGQHLDANRQIFVCGPSPMMNAVLQILRENGLQGQFSLKSHGLRRRRLPGMRGSGQ